MKRLIASASVLAASAAMLPAQNLAGVPQTKKFWTVSAALRGFYDDNYRAVPESRFGTERFESPGFQFTPGFKLSYPGERTAVNVGYDYTLREFFKPRSEIDHTHQATLELDHRFTERYRLNFYDALVSSQEADLVAGGRGTVTSFNASALHNIARIKFTAFLSRQFVNDFSYENHWWDYKQSGTINSYSALLDRLEHSFDESVRWILRQSLSGRVGYRYSFVDYTSSDVSVVPGTGAIIPKGDKNSTTHGPYVGGLWQLASTISLDGNVGFSLTDYESRRLDGQISPYVNIGGNYRYAQGSQVRLGFNYARSATDQLRSDGRGGFTVDTVASSLYLDVTHRITPKLTANLNLTWQNTDYQGSDSGTYYLLGTALTYQFTRNWAADLGYNWDQYATVVRNPNRPYEWDRNRIYLGVRVTY